MRQIVLALMAVVTFSAAQAETPAPLELLMIDQPGCEWCALWDSEVGVVYPKTPEGARAPLRRLGIRSAALRELTLKSRPRFTPTFILMSNGAEIGRIEGYPGEDFFWGLLQKLLRDAPASPESPAPPRL